MYVLHICVKLWQICSNYPSEKMQRLTRFCSWDLGLKTAFQIYNTSLKNRKEIEVLVGMVFFWGWQCVMLSKRALGWFAAKKTEKYNFDGQPYLKLVFVVWDMPVLQ